MMRKVRYASMVEEWPMNMWEVEVTEWLVGRLVLLRKVFYRTCHGFDRRTAKPHVAWYVTSGPTGKMDEKTTFDSSDFRNTLPRFTPEALKANQALIDLLDKIGKRKTATPAQIALAWLLAQKPWIVPIPGTTKLHRLEENIGAVAVELTPDDLREIDSAASKITVHGARYPEMLEQMTGR